MTRKPSGPTSRMLKGPVGTRRTEKGPSRDFYDELQASRMSKCGSYSYTSEEKGPTGTRRMEKVQLEIYDEAVRYRSNIVRHRCVISSMTKPCSL